MTTPKTEAGRRFPTTDRDEMAYLIDSWIWAEGAAALRAALSPEQPEVTE